MMLACRSCEFWIFIVSTDRDSTHTTATMDGTFGIDGDSLEHGIV